jgi:pimeloyl-ACP methyl ester carboxylesterase
VVLLHGWAIAGATTWSPTIDRLADRYRVVALDHRGHGQGIDDDGSFTLDACADDVASLLAALDIDHAVLVGFSMGGPIAQLVWRRHPDVVDGLVMVATGADFGSSVIARIGMQAVEGAGTPLRLLPTWLRRHGARSVLRWFVADPSARAALAQEFAANRDTVLIAALKELRAFRSAGWLAEVDVPTAVVVTERDRVVTPDEQRRLAAALPEPLVVHVDQDHLCFVTEPDVFAAAVDAAVAGVVERLPLGRRPWARRPGRLRAWWHRWRALRRERRAARRARERPDPGSLQ